MDAIGNRVDSKTLAQSIFEGVCRSGAIAKGHFVVLDGCRITIPGGALDDSFSKALYYIDVLQEDETKDPLVRVTTSNRDLSRDALIEGASDHETVRCDKVDGVFCLCSTISMCGDVIGSTVDDIINACLVLDGAMAAAMAYDASDNPAFRAELDSGRLFEGFGFGTAAPYIARSFDEEYGHPCDKALAAYALPYNLQKIADSGVLDAVIAECGGGFGLYKLTWRRWLFCVEIVGALQARGFANEQVAYIICHDEDLFDAPESRRDAEALCERIRESSYDPDDVGRWNDYLATETGPLTGFL